VYWKEELVVEMEAMDVMGKKVGLKGREAKKGSSRVCPCKPRFQLLLTLQSRS